MEIHEYVDDHYFILYARGWVDVVEMAIAAETRHRARYDDAGVNTHDADWFPGSVLRGFAVLDANGEIVGVDEVGGDEPITFLAMPG